MISMEEKIAMAEQNIRLAMIDYNEHIALEDRILTGESFVKRLAEGSTKAKQGLRELFRKSPSWDEELDAIVLNGNRTHEPDPRKVHDGIIDLLVTSELMLTWETLQRREPQKIG